jgi:predicted TPR repeat methyltransferase
MSGMLAHGNRRDQGACTAAAAGPSAAAAGTGTATATATLSDGAAAAEGDAVYCSICYESWPPLPLHGDADQASTAAVARVPDGIRCEAARGGHFVDAECLRMFAHHEFDMVRLAKTFGAVGCPDPGCAGAPGGGVPYAEDALCAVLGGDAAEPWRSFVTARASLPLRLARGKPPSTAPLVELSPQLAAVEPWLRYLEMDVLDPRSTSAAATPPSPPLRLWACRGFGGGDGNNGGSAGGLGVQLWPAAITLAARAATYAQAHHRVCDLGCGVGLVGLSWLHAARCTTAATAQMQRRRLVLTDADSECLSLARCNIQAVEKQHSGAFGRHEEDDCDVSTAVLRWGDVDAARALAEGAGDCGGGGAADGVQHTNGFEKRGFDLILGTDLLYFAGAEVTQRLAATIAALLTPSFSGDSATEEDEKRFVCDSKAVLANHGGWFNDALEQCLHDSAVSVCICTVRTSSSMGRLTNRRTDRQEL